MSSSAVSSPLRPELWSRLLSLTAISAIFVLVYPTANWITSIRSDVMTCVFEWEKFIPFIPWMIIPYWSIDLFFIGSVFAVRSESQLRALVSRIVFSVIIAGVFFLLFPLELVWDKPELDGVYGWLFSVLKGFDRPYNLAPSLHIALRTILWAVYIPPARGRMKTVLTGWFVLIGVSTLYTWQHHVIDIVAGQLLGLLALHLFPERAKMPARKEVTPRAILVGTQYAGGALLLLMAAILTFPYGVIILWPALALGIVAVAYFHGSAWLLGKEGGRVRTESRLLLGPYFLGAFLFHRYFSQNREPHVEVAPGLWMGRRLGDEEAGDIISKGVSAVLDLTSERSECRTFCEIPYKNIPVLDFTNPTQAQLREAVLYIREERKKGAVYVHCALGLSRSATVVAAYLLSEGIAPSVYDSMDLIKSRRPSAIFRPDSAVHLLQFANGSKRAVGYGSLALAAFITGVP